MIEDRGCPICSGSTRLHLTANEPSAAPRATDDRTRHPDILRCDACGVAFAALRPGDDLLARQYRESAGNVYDQESHSREISARRLLRLVHRYARPGRLLDVGCASGFFLQRAALAGWLVTGVEPSRALVRGAAGRLQGNATLVNDTLQDAALPLDSFDVVTAWDVLEHVGDPVAFLRRCRALLRPGGHLFVKTPDIGSVVARAFGRRWPLLLAEHVFYFTSTSLRIAGDRAGLSRVDHGHGVAWFSLGYITRRLIEHRIPGAQRVAVILSRLGAGAMAVPVLPGEIHVIWSR